MTYRQKQREKAINQRDELFKDPGQGKYNDASWAFVLQNSELSLWEGIRQDAIHYFVHHGIPFWESKLPHPVGHLLSSQDACLNHLFFARQREDVATQILKGLDKNVIRALKMDNGDSLDGYVEFEVIGSKNYLNEIAHTRGEYSTSIDTVMLAELDNGDKKLFFIEWKFTEYYDNTCYADGSSGKTRKRIYNPFLLQPDSPFLIADPEALFYEPFYQLMRQTLLAHEMIKAKEYGATSYLHVHVIPDENSELKNVNPSPKLTGADLESAWKTTLKLPENYLCIRPIKFLQPAQNCPDIKSIFTYLEKRYWE